MNAPSTTPRVLTDVERSLLTQLFTAMPYAENAVDSVVFRAQHHEELDAINQLETEQLIRKEQERYCVSLPALALIETTESKKLLARAELLYAAMRREYLADPRKPVPVSMLALSAGVEEAEARRALSYMLTGNTLWVSSHPLKLLDNDAATIVASEGIIARKSFQAVIAQLDEWRTHGPYAYEYVALKEAPAAALATDAQSAHASSGKIPPWISKLPPTICQVMTEVHIAINSGLRALPAIGVRTSLDLLFAELLGGDRGTFEEKVAQLNAKGLLTPADQTHVLAVIDGGSASAHRGYVPDDEDMATFLAVAERLLLAHYVLPGASTRLRANTPPRPAKPKKNSTTP